MDASNKDDYILADEIIKIVADYFNIDKQYILNTTKDKTINNIRYIKKITMYLIKKQTLMTSPAIMCLMQVYANPSFFHWLEDEVNRNAEMKKDVEKLGNRIKILTW